MIRENLSPYGNRQSFLIYSIRLHDTFGCSQLIGVNRIGDERFL
jgi:hypothetical protein